MRPFASDTKLARTLLILCAAGSMLMSCRNLPPSDAVAVTSTSGGGSSSSSGSGSSGTSSISAALYIQVLTQWEGTSTWIDAGNCQVPLGTTPSSGYNLPCTIHVPEARLYFSSTRFLVGTAAPTTCKVVSFSPYYYMGSTSNAYTPPWDPNAPVLNCSTGPYPPAGCFNGPATKLVSDFPKHTGLYFLSDHVLEYPFDVVSANSLSQPDNKWTSNAMTVNRGLNRVDGFGNQIYEGGTIQDYVVSCTDEWYEKQYTITLTFADEDSASGEDPNGPLNNFSDWDGY